MKNKKILEIVIQKEILLKSKIFTYISQSEMLNKLDLNNFLLLSEKSLILKTIENKKIKLKFQIFETNKQLEIITKAKDRLEEIIKQEEKQIKKQQNQKINEEICLLSQF